jgi:hypothetical protein
MFLAILLALAPLASGPYCGTSESDFTAPTPLACDEGWHPDTNCLRACAALYRAEMQIAYEAACANWTTTMNAWDAAQDQVDADLTACVTAAQGFPAMIDACNVTWGTQTTALQSQLNADLAAIQARIDASFADAEASFQECVSGCCAPDELVLYVAF